ncbi:MAG: ABC transporter substrate-binding protein [Amphritea sp.]|nr:ABC transporter substrate-binding protein [Amphritea sp.]MBQ0785007.1 ABC transporter substrate-binding protein [Amphritea sp.]
MNNKVTTVIATAVLGFSSAALAEDVRLYNVASMSGAFANFGEQGEIGARLAVDTAGKIDGVSLELVTVDTESNAGKAARKVKSIIAEDGGLLFVGSTLSSTALAVGKEVNRAAGVYVTGSGADEITGSQCNQATFRWSTPTYGAVNASLQPLLDKHPDIKRIYTITPQYVFGEAMLENTRKVAAARGVEVVGNSYHSLKEKEFSGYLTQAMAAKPDLLVLLNFGSQSEATIKQAVNFGMKNRMKIVQVWSNGLDTMRTLGSSVSDGLYFGAQYWHEDTSPANQAFVKLSRDKLGLTPTYAMASYYQMSKLLIDSVKAVGTDSAKIRTHMEGLEYQGVAGHEVVRSDDHQVEKSFYLLEGKSKDEMVDAVDFADIVATNKYFVSPQESGCNLASL